MILREYLLRPDWLTSERVQALPDHLQLFFVRLCHACDGAGRFEAAAMILRAALYPRALHKVSERDVQANLVRLHERGLVKLYTVGARGFGEVLNYRQRDAKRKVRYPSEAALELFPPATADPPDAGAGAARSELNRREFPLEPPQGGAPEQPPLPDRRRPRRRGRLFPREIEARLKAAENALYEIERPGGASWRGNYSAAETVRRGELTREVAALKTALRQAVRDSIGGEEETA